MWEPNAIMALAFSPNGRLLAAGGHYHDTRVWNVADGRLLNTAWPQGDIVLGLCFSPDGQTLAVGTWGREVRLWNVNLGTMRRAPLMHDEHVFRVLFNPAGDRLLSMGLQAAHLWNPATGEKVAVLKFDRPAMPEREQLDLKAVFSPDGKTLLTSSGHGMLRFWDGATGKPLGPAVGMDKIEECCFAFSPDGTLVVAGHEQGQAQLWEVASSRMFGRRWCLDQPSAASRLIPMGDPFARSPSMDQSAAGRFHRPWKERLASLQGKSNCPPPADWMTAEWSSRCNGRNGLCFRGKIARPRDFGTSCGMIGHHGLEIFPMKITVRFLAALIFMPISVIRAAEPRLADLFSDHMVLQCDIPIPVWGAADAGAPIRVEFGGQSKTTLADDNGKWRVKLDPLSATDKPRELVVTAGKESIRRGDVLVGEVWLASGQSNMGLPVSACAMAEKEIAAADHPLLRYFNVEQHPSLTPLTTVKGRWMICASHGRIVFRDGVLLRPAVAT